MSPLLIKFLVGGALLAGLVSWGVLERGEKLAAQAENAQLKIDVAELGKKIATCNSAVDVWKKSADDAHKYALEALRTAQGEAKRHAAERQSLQTALKAPTPSKATCDSAWLIIEELVTKRPPNGPPK